MAREHHLCFRYIHISIREKEPFLKFHWKFDVHPGMYEVHRALWVGITWRGQTWGYVIGGSPEIFHD